MDSGTTVGDSKDRRRGGIHKSQGIGRQNVATKSSESSLDLASDLEIGRLEDSTSERGESERKVSTEGAARVSARTARGQTSKVASVSKQH